MMVKVHVMDENSDFIPLLKSEWILTDAATWVSTVWILQTLII